VTNRSPGRAGGRRPAELRSLTRVGIRFPLLDWRRESHGVRNGRGTADSGGLYTALDRIVREP
jgi:hypothetical protein